jgi:ribosomal protein S18 acetylase RimI-like enzyme
MAHSRDLLVRPAVRGDREFLFAVRRAALRTYVEETSGWVDAEQRAIADREFGELPYAVVEEGGRPVGYVCVIQEGEYDFLEEIALLPEAQGRGIGTRLVRDVLRAARRRGVPVRLSVFASNPAQALYARLGFHVVGIEDPRTKMEWRPSPPAGPGGRV